MPSFKNLADIADETSSKDTPAVPKTSGAPLPAKDMSKSDVANRDPGARKAGATPRPTDKPITGGDRG